MSLFDEDIPKKKPDIAVGDDLSRLSIHELEERIEALRAEIARAEESMQAKRASAGAAESFFKR